MSGSGPVSSLRDFEVVKTLGEGSFAKVYQVIRKPDSQTYAMKKCKIGLMNQKDKDNSLNEVRILASIRNPYVIAYKEAIYDESSECLFVIMEYAAGGDLMHQVKHAIKNKSQIEEKQIWIWTIQILHGLKYLHDLKIIHRDLKCANIFLDSKGTIKIGDLNVSKITEANLANTQVGTPYYTSPEVWKEHTYNNKSDIWSLGCLLYELCALRPPFTAPDLPSLFQKISKGSYERIPPKETYVKLRYSNELSHFVSQCLQVNKSLRLDCDQLLGLSIVCRKAEEMGLRAEGNLREDTLPTSNSQQNLLEIIRFPSNKRMLQDRLPKSSYHSISSLELHKIQSNPPPLEVHKVSQNLPAATNIQSSKNIIPKIQVGESQEQQKILRRARSSSGIQLKLVTPCSQFDVLLEQEIQKRLATLNSQQRDKHLLLQPKQLSQHHQLHPPVVQSRENISSAQVYSRKARNISEDMYQAQQTKAPYMNNIPVFHKQTVERKQYDGKKDQENITYLANRMQLPQLHKQDIITFKIPHSIDSNKHIKKPPIRSDMSIPYQLKLEPHFPQKRVQTEFKQCPLPPYFYR